MQRLTARFLLFVALAGNLAPLAIAAATPPHACCVRKAAHHCHDSAAAESSQLVIRDVGSCNHDCCRAVTTAQSAHAQPPATAFFAQNIEAYLGRPSSSSLSATVSSYQSTRAPPQLSIA